MIVPHEVVDEHLVLANGLGALAVRDTGGGNDAFVAAHVIHESNESLVEDGKFLVEQGFGCGRVDVGHKNL